LQQSIIDDTKVKSTEQLLVLLKNSAPKNIDYADELDLATVQKFFAKDATDSEIQHFNIGYYRMVDQSGKTKADNYMTVTLHLSADNSDDSDFESKACEGKDSDAAAPTIALNEPMTLTS
jgi:hypothetical protein